MGVRTDRTNSCMLVTVSCALFLVLGFSVASTPVTAATLPFLEEGDLALATGNWKRAEDLFTQAIKASPRNYVAYHNRAIAYSKQGKYDRCIADLKKATTLNPNYPDAYGLMGLVWEIKNKLPEAVQAYKSALKYEKRPEARKTLQKWIKDLQNKMKRK